MTKRLYVENVDGWNKYLSKERLSDEELEVKVVERGVVLPSRVVGFGMYTGGVCDENLNFVAGYQRKKGDSGSKRTFNCLEKSYAVDRKSIVEIDEDAIFGGLLAEHFGHFLVECFCRLWYVIQNPSAQSKIIFLTTLKGGRHRSYTDDFLKLMGIDTARIIYVDKPMQFRSITVPEQAQYDFERLTKEFFLPYREIMSRVKPGNLKKIYLTRTGFEFRKHGNVHCFNEKYFEDFFKARGFEVVSPEKLKIEEQISLIMGADEIAANLGTLTHFAIFCKPGAKFIMINRTSRYVSTAQSAINATFDFDYYVVDGSKNFLYADRSHGVCLFGANKYWKAFVADYFGEEIDEDDDKDYLEEALNKYVDFWYEKYSDSKEVIIDSLKEMCRKIVAIDTPPKNRPTLSYQTHVAFKGWSEWADENSFSNPLDKKRNIQAIKINFFSHKIFYAVYWNDAEGWSEEVASPEPAGTTGKNKPITGIKIRLDEEGAKNFDILYRVHTFDDIWTAWAKNGEEILSHGVKLNAVQIKLQANVKNPLIAYQTHVHNKGWCSWASENSISNDIDQEFDIQAIKIAFAKPIHAVYYSVYFNDTEGWSKEIAAPEEVGTTGKNKSIAGIKIRLDEMDAQKFDICYRIHKFGGEWTAWAKNGEEILSHGVKLNAIQIKLQAK